MSLGNALLLCTVEIAKKDIDIMTIPDGSLTMVHEPKFKVDLTKYLEHHKFKYLYNRHTITYLLIIFLSIVLTMHLTRVLPTP